MQEARGPRLGEVDLGAGVHAAFTSAHGGVSPAPWRSLNLGLNTGDEAERVLANRAALTRALGAPVVFATQVHGTDVLRVEEPLEQGASSCGPADALVVTRPGLAIAVLVADCVPVLLADAVGRVAAVVHAGRRGLAAGILTRAIGAMDEAGAEPGRIRAAVGPAACGRCYEVPEQMRHEVAAAVPGTWSETRDGTPALDLPGGVVAELERCGVGAVTHLGRCTIEDPQLFSYRRAAPDGRTGRFAGLVVLV